MLSDTLIAIPDRPGNKRVDTFHNILLDPRVSLIFFVPGKMETLRLRGTARLCKDRDLLDSMAINNHSPKLFRLRTSQVDESIDKRCKPCRERPLTVTRVPSAGQQVDFTG